LTAPTGSNERRDCIFVTHPPAIPHVTAAAFPADSDSSLAIYLEFIDLRP